MGQIELTSQQHTHAHNTQTICTPAEAQLEMEEAAGNSCQRVKMLQRLNLFGFCVCARVRARYFFLFFTEGPTRAHLYPLRIPFMFTKGLKFIPPPL